MRRRRARNPISYLPWPLVVGLGAIAGVLTFAIARVVVVAPSAPAVVKV